MSVKKDKTEDFLKLYDKIEKDFNFMGATAIEDKLQDVINFLNYYFNKISGSSRNNRNANESRY